MPLFGYEGLIMAAILITLFLWGPSKIPEMARAIGQAKREFDKAAKEVTSFADVKSITTPITDSINKTITSPLTSPPVISKQTTPQPPQDPVIIAAKSLGISTLGKTKQELVTEITNLTTKK
ncbi:MAG: twin-arginine translocase TatA/TatE family subunit [Candidatus Bathyarchaeia archaeon]